MVVRAYCYAKLNLFLKVYGVRPDGFHNIISVMQSVDIADSLLIAESGEGGIKIECSTDRIPTDSSNLVYKAVEKLAIKAGREPGGVKITLDKGIPLMGGLAGGSADAAGTLTGLKRLWNLDIEESQLFELAAEIGSDVPFCFVGGTALVRGRGEILESLGAGLASSSPSTGAFLVVVPNIHVNTAEAYNLIDKSREAEARKWGDLNPECQLIQEAWLEAIINRNFPALFHNDFEIPVLDAHPELKEIHTNLRNTAGHALMSGSGSCVFAYFNRIEDALHIRDFYVPVSKEVALVTFPVGDGVKLEEYNLND